MDTKTTKLDLFDVVGEEKAPLPLMPDRHPQHDLFICDVADAVLKDVMAHMEHPFYSLSKKPETNVRRYEHNGNWIELSLIHISEPTRLV